MEHDLKMKLQELVDEERAAGTPLQDIINTLTEQTVVLTSEELEETDAEDEDDEDAPAA